MDQSPNQQEFFTHLNAKEGVGVFLFPSGKLSQADQLSILSATVQAVDYIQEVVGDTKTKVRNAKAPTHIFEWLSNYKSRLSIAIDRLKVNGNVDIEIETDGQTNGDSEESGSAGTTLNGHGA